MRQHGESEPPVTATFSNDRNRPIAVISVERQSAGMGTVGGKIGFGLGIVVGLLAVPSMIRLFLGDCFFEQGCGDSETAGLALVVVGSIGMAIAAGLLIRLALNKLVRASR
jgi:hypothetical protein